MSSSKNIGVDKKHIPNALKSCFTDSAGFWLAVKMPYLSNALLKFAPVCLLVKFNPV